MADITKTVSDTIVFSTIPDSDGMIQNGVSEVISPSGAPASGRLYESLGDTLTIVLPSGEVYSGDKTVDETISFGAAPSGNLNLYPYITFDEDPLSIGDYYDPSSEPDQNKNVGSEMVEISDNVPTEFSEYNKSTESSISIQNLPSPSGQFIISSPPNGSSFYHGHRINFSGSGIDDEGIINSSNIIWYSSIDGIIGRGLFFYSNSLSVGTHTIKASSVLQGQFFTESEVTILKNSFGDRVEEITNG